MLSIGTTHVNAWRGFNYGKNAMSNDFVDAEFDDAPPDFIASARHFIAGRSADYAKPKIAMESE